MIGLMFSPYRLVLYPSVGGSAASGRGKLGSSYCTSPRRTSSIAATVGFLEVLGRKLRAPFCNCRARLAATMIKRYALASGSSGITLWAVCFRLISAIFECLQNRANFSFHPVSPAPRGLHNGGQLFHG